MTKAVTKIDPAQFNLTSFADLLAGRDVIVGEVPGSYATYETHMLSSLAPMVPYECVIAQDIIAMSWELLQHKRMRDNGLRQLIHRGIVAAVIAAEQAKHASARKASAGKGAKTGFDEAAAQAAGEALAAEAVSTDPEVQTAAFAQITALGMDPLALMSAAYRMSDDAVEYHDRKIQELERRRREMKRDYDVLQKTRPLDVGRDAPADAEIVAAPASAAQPAPKKVRAAT